MPVAGPRFSPLAPAARGGDREQEDQGVDAVTHVWVLPVPDLRDGENDQGEDDRRSEGAAGDRWSYRDTCRTAREPNQRHGTEDDEGAATEQKQQEAD